MKKQRIVIICPGRGAYTRETSSYLKKNGAQANSQVDWMDRQRMSAGLPSLSDLDTMPFKGNIHMAGEHASALIYACSLSDFLSIDQKKYEIVAITGNSMGWYIGMGLGGAINYENTYHLIQTMGAMMSDRIIGGQIIYPITNKNWQVDQAKKEIVLDEIKKVDAHVSIYLGGYLVIGGEQSALDILLKKLPAENKYPFQIPFHAAFHTPLMHGVSQKGMAKLSTSFFQKPKIPLIDGRGHIWTPFSTDVNELYDYTLGRQVVSTYDFSTAITVALKEFCPEKLVLLGPGSSLGGSIGQIIIKNNWLDIDSKLAFSKRQKSEPYLISMGINDQRNILA